MCGISIAKIQVNNQQHNHKCYTHANVISKKDMPKGYPDKVQITNMGTSEIAHFFLHQND
jgi:hypothetical protein